MAERNLLKIGGIAGILAGIIFLFSYGVLFSYVPVTCCTERFLRELPQFRVAWIVVNTLIASAVLLNIPVFLGLYRLLRETNVGYALLGAALGVIAATVGGITISVGVSASVGFAQLYETATDKEAVVTAAAVVQSLTGGVFPPTTVLLGIAFATVGAAMRGSAAFPKGYRWISEILGVILILSITVGSLLQLFGLFAVIILAWITWLVLVGLKLYRLSGSHRGAVGNIRG